VTSSGSLRNIRPRTSWQMFRAFCRNVGITGWAIVPELGLILDPRKKKGNDPTVAKKVNPHRFFDHKEQVAGLTARVARVLMQTRENVAAMGEGQRE